MSRPMTPLNKAASKFECPTCEVGEDERCINRNTGADVPTHAARQHLVCQVTFLNLPAIVYSRSSVDGESAMHVMFCGRRKGHRSKHQTPDGRLNWDHKFGDDWDLRAAVAEELDPAS